jgi:hypothetical protein
MGNPLRTIFYMKLTPENSTVDTMPKAAMAMVLQ